MKTLNKKEQNQVRHTIRKAFKAGKLLARQVRSDARNIANAEWKTAQEIHLSIDELKGGRSAYGISELENGVFLLSRIYAGFEVKVA